MPAARVLLRMGCGGDGCWSICPKWFYLLYGYFFLVFWFLRSAPRGWRWVIMYIVSFLSFSFSGGGGTHRRLWEEEEEEEGGERGGGGVGLD